MCGVDGLATQGARGGSGVEAVEQLLFQNARLAIASAGELRGELAKFCG